MKTPPKKPPPEDNKVVWPFPPFPNPKDVGRNLPKFNPNNYEDAPL